MLLLTRFATKVLCNIKLALRSLQKMSIVLAQVIQLAEYKHKPLIVKGVSAAMACIY